MTVNRGRWADLDPLTLHDILRLRVDVFVVEQACPYPEIDGRDVEPTTEHVWLNDDRGLAAYLRSWRRRTAPDGSAVSSPVPTPEAKDWRRVCSRTS